MGLPPLSDLAAAAEICRRVYTDRVARPRQLDGGDINQVLGLSVHVDVILSAPAVPGFAANTEDAVGLQALNCAASCTSTSRMWSRVLLRRDHVKHLLGLDLDESVLSFSDRQGLLPVCFLDLDVALYDASNSRP